MTFDFTSFGAPASREAIVLEEWLGILGIRVHSLEFAGVGFQSRGIGDPARRFHALLGVIIAAERIA